MSKPARGMALLFLCFLLFSGSAETRQLKLTPFVMDWRNNSESLVDLSFLYDGPAGRDGHITVRKGHLAKPDGERFRIWGINFTAAACFPPKDQAATVAAHLARFGINCVRFHFLDSAGPASIFGLNKDNTRSLDPGQLDKLDYFIEWSVCPVARKRIDCKNG